MPTYRYYITDLMEGTVVGTDDTNIAMHFAQSEDNYVVEPATNQWLLPDGDKATVNPAPRPDDLIDYSV
jgi:hypothetical protein